VTTDSQTASPAPAETARLAFRGPEDEINPAFVATAAGLIAAADKDGLVALTEDLHEADLAALIEHLDADDRPRLIDLLGRDFDFTALTEVDDKVREDILDELAPKTVAEGVAGLDSDDAVYILEDLDEAEKQEVLQALPAPDRGAIERALVFPDNSAGRRMNADVIAVPPFWTIGQTIDFMRETPDLPDTFFEIFVVDPGHRYLGSVPLDRLLRAKRPVRVADLMAPERHVVQATDDVGDVAREFQRYNLVSAPVVSESRLVGVITFDDMGDVIEEELADDIKALGGVAAGEEMSDSVTRIARGRFTWLFVNLLTAILASFVIGFFAQSLEKMVALAILMPIVASMGGNAGTQTMTVAVRALATRELGRANAWRIVGRETAVGLVNGIAFAVIMGLVAQFWFNIPGLAVVIGLAFVFVLVAAALGGIVIPLVLERFGVDPAVSSGPFVTTITDVVGFFTFLGIATLWFGLK
jgi:magnesium transporter